MRNARLLSPLKSRRFNGQRSLHKALPVQDDAHRGHVVLSHRPRGHNPFTVGHESDGIQFLRNAEEFLGSRELWLAAVGAGFHRINLVSLAVVQLFAVGWTTQKTVSKEWGSYCGSNQRASNNNKSRQRAIPKQARKATETNIAVRASMRAM